MALQGPHHSAQKSTSTSPAPCSTSPPKLASVTWVMLPLSLMFVLCSCYLRSHGRPAPHRARGRRRTGPRGRARVLSRRPRPGPAARRICRRRRHHLPPARRERDRAALPAGAGGTDCPLSRAARRGHPPHLLPSARPRPRPRGLVPRPIEFADGAAIISLPLGESEIEL